MRLHNSIVSGNEEKNLSLSDIVAHNGGVDAVSSHNFVNFLSGGLVNGNNGNQVQVGNPGLLPLAYNGGSTMTHQLLATSPAYNAGNNAQAPGGADQRGGAFARIVNGTIDIGLLKFR